MYERPHLHTFSHPRRLPTAPLFEKTLHLGHPNIVGTHRRFTQESAAQTGGTCSVYRQMVRCHFIAKHIIEIHKRSGLAWHHVVRQEVAEIITDVVWLMSFTGGRHTGKRTEPAVMRCRGRLHLRVVRAQRPDRGRSAAGINNNGAVEVKRGRAVKQVGHPVHLNTVRGFDESVQFGERQSCSFVHLEVRPALKAYKDTGRPACEACRATKQDILNRNSNAIVFLGKRQYCVLDRVQPPASNSNRRAASPSQKQTTLGETPPVHTPLILLLPCDHVIVNKRQQGLHGIECT